MVNESFTNAGAYKQASVVEEPSTKVSMALQTMKSLPSLRKLHVAGIPHLKITHVLTINISSLHPEAVKISGRMSMSLTTDTHGMKRNLDHELADDETREVSLAPTIDTFARPVCVIKTRLTAFQYEEGRPTERLRNTPAMSIDKEETSSCEPTSCFINFRTRSDN